MNSKSRGSDLDVKPIQPAYQQVADQVRSLVVSGELAPDSRLPNEGELATIFGVSRSTVREALRLLASQGLITTTRGVNGGSFVAYPETEHITQYLETSLGLLTSVDQVSVDDLIEVRAMLEVPAAGLAAERRTPGDLAHLRTMLNKEQGSTDVNTFDKPRHFHQALVEAAGNPLLPVLARPLFVTIRMRFVREEAPAEFWHSVASDHEEIYDLVESGDAEAAAERMRAHLASIASTYKRIDRGSLS